MYMRVNKLGTKKSNRFEIIYLLTVLVGTFAGTLAFLAGYSYLGEGSVLKTVTYSPIEIFLKYLLGNSLFMIISFVCGLSAVLQPLLFLSAAAKGFILGIEISRGYFVAGAENIPVVFAAGILPSVISVFCLLIASRDAFYLSVNVASAIFSDKNFIGLREAFRLYCTKYFILFVILTVGAGMNCLLVWIL